MVVGRRGGPRGRDGDHAGVDGQEGEVPAPALSVSPVLSALRSCPPRFRWLHCRLLHPTGFRPCELCKGAMRWPHRCIPGLEDLTRPAPLEARQRRSGRPLQARVVIRAKLKCGSSRLSLPVARVPGPAGPQTHTSAQPEWPQICPSNHRSSASTRPVTRRPR